MRDMIINPGDRFSKVSDPGTVWIAVQEAPLAQGMPPHIYLANEKIPSRRIMMAQSALLDKRLFKRVES